MNIRKEKKFATIQEAAVITGKSVHTIHWLIKNKKITKETGLINGRNVSLLPIQELCDYYGIDPSAVNITHVTSNLPVNNQESNNKTIPVKSNKGLTSNDFLEFQDKIESKINARYEGHVKEKDRVIQRLEQQKESLQNMLIEEKGEKGAMAGELNFLREKVILLESETVSVRKKTKQMLVKMGYGAGILMIGSAIVIFIFAPLLFK